jgi:hypothetical protein
VPSPVVIPHAYNRVQSNERIRDPTKLSSKLQQILQSTAWTSSYMSIPIAEEKGGFRPRDAASPPPVMAGRRGSVQVREFQGGVWMVQRRKRAPGQHSKRTRRQHVVELDKSGAGLAACTLNHLPDR